MFFQHSPHCSLYMCDLRWARAPVVVVLVVDYDAAFRSLLDAGVGCSYSDGFARFLGVDVVAEEKGGEVVGGGGSCCGGSCCSSWSPSWL